MILKRSQFEVGCTLQGLDVLVPDDTNFDQSKFIVLQTGSVILKSRNDPAKTSGQSFDPYFSTILDRSVL